MLRKEPYRVEDIAGFYNRYLNSIVPMINRINICDRKLLFNGQPLVFGWDIFMANPKTGKKQQLAGVVCGGAPEQMVLACGRISYDTV